MGEQSYFNNLMMNLRSTCKYYTGYPKDLGPSRVIHFTSEREFVHLLHQGHPVIVAFTIKSNYTKHLDKVLEEAAVEFYPQIKFMRVECPKYIGFCMTRQKKDYPFIEMFHSPAQAVSDQGKAVDPNVTKYAVKVLPYNYDVSAYGFRGRSRFRRSNSKTSKQSKFNEEKPPHLKCGPPPHLASSASSAPVESEPKSGGSATTPAPVSLASSVPVRSEPRSGGFVANMVATVTDGFIWSTGNAMAHRAMDAIMGPRTIQIENVPAVQVASSAADACAEQNKAFIDCINSSGNDTSKCQFYMDMLSECRKSGSATPIAASF